MTPRQLPRPGARRRGQRRLLGLLLLVLSAGCAPAPSPTAPTSCPAPWQPRPGARPPLPPWQGCDPADPARQIHDQARPALLAASSRQRAELRELLAAACREDLELLVVAAQPSSRGFSLVDHADQLWRCGGEQAGRAVLVASRRGGVHARLSWLSHARVRELAHAADRLAAGNRTTALIELTRELLAQHRERQRTRRILLTVSVFAALWLAFFTVRALWRQSSPPGARGAVAGRERV
ncbi:MAG: hypothetical protein RBU45_09135 [Myxococcota bacterium]|jgi:hypothetical protein|nr:hypothetical protein [Myxococcota bacterium]